MKRKVALGIILCIVLTSGSMQFSFAQKAVPDWIKQAAGWYSQGLVSEKEFLDAIKFLIQEKIILLDEKVIEDPTLLVTEPIITKPKLRQCDILYQSYKNIGVVKFQQKYSFIHYLDSCIKLYRDPIWNYTGEDRYEKLSERLSTLESNTEEKKLSYEPSVKILSKTKVGTEKYQVKFNICAGDKAIDKAKVLIKSQIEAIQVGSNKDVPANACRNYETQIYSKNPDNISVEILEEVIVR